LTDKRINTNHAVVRAVGGLAIGGLAMAKLWLHGILALGLALSSVALAQAQDSGRSWPKDTNIYTRAAVPADTTAPAGVPSPPPPTSTNLMRVNDVIIDNTNTNLKTSDFTGGSEPSIAINPNNRNEIVITSFSGAWGTYPSYAPLWLSRDGGQTWTKEFTIGQPYNVNTGTNCPCDQTFDYGVGYVNGNPLYSQLFGSILAGSAGDNIYTGHIVDPTLQGNWDYYYDSATNASQTTNRQASSIGQADQPWMLRSRTTGSATADQVHVAYDNFGVTPVSIRVSSTDTTTPPHFPNPYDVQTGTALNSAYNPGHRLAVDPRNGWVYSLWQNCNNTNGNCTTYLGNPKTIEYHLNRSTDNGLTYSLNGSSTGVLVSIGLSSQPNPKFGTVNALFGGVDHAAVDPSTGDLYYVYGSADSNLNNGLLMIRAFDNGQGGVSFDTFHNVFAPTSGVQAALPQVAVTQHGTVGVFYYTYNGTVSGFPQFTAWLAVSTDKGATFTTQQLKTFLSPTTDNGNDHQRIIGDFVQMKAIDNCFYGSFIANRAAFSGSIAIMDPIFFKSCYGQSASTHDLSGDGYSDILWRDTSGNLAMWFMYGTTTTSASGAGTVTTDWQVVGQRDFNGDGFTDILWRNQNSGQVAMWFMNGATLVSGGTPGVVTTDWFIAGTGDFNGDGYGDILWRNVNTGQVAVWLMFGSTILGTSGSPATVTTDWVIAGTGDFNGDGMTDILWSNASNGQVAIWLMNGAAISSAAYVGTVGAGWKIVGTGDFNGDGKGDILWWNQFSGQVAMWFMSGTIVAGGGSPGSVTTNWAIVATGDFNADGMGDILWRDTSGNTAMWLMNGATILPSSASLGNVATVWTIQGSNAD
jgi:hypothetical protein